MEGPPSDLATLLGDSAEPTLHIVRDIDQATTDGGVERLAAYFEALVSLDGPVWMVATASDGSSTADLPFRQLLHYFDISIAVPPLRCRTDDLPALTAALLRGGIAPRTSCADEPGSDAAPLTLFVAAQHIPAAGGAGARRAAAPVGEIQTADVPGYCQTVARHTLTPPWRVPSETRSSRRCGSPRGTGWPRQPIWVWPAPASTASSRPTASPYDGKKLSKDRTVQQLSLPLTSGDRGRPIAPPPHKRGEPVTMIPAPPGSA